MIGIILNPEPAPDRSVSVLPRPQLPPLSPGPPWTSQGSCAVRFADRCSSASRQGIRVVYMHKGNSSSKKLCYRNF